MVYISLIALFATITNYVPLSAIGFAPILLCAWRFFDRDYPLFVVIFAALVLYALTSTLLYDPASLTSFEFYRRDGNLFIAYAPVLAGCLYSHKLDLDRILRGFYVFVILANLPRYGIYLAQHGVLAFLSDSEATYGSYFIARNAAGGFLAIILCLGLACYLSNRSKLMLGLLAINALMLLSTYSRGSMLGIPAVMLYLALGRKRWFLFVMMACLVLASFYIALHNSNPSIDYMGEPFDIQNPDEKQANLDIRSQWLWPRALAYFSESPIFGIGFGSFDDQITSVISYFGIISEPLGVTAVHTDAHAHNSYLNIAAELGLVGLGLLLCFFWYLIGWALHGARFARQSRCAGYIAFVFVELSSVCLLVMSFSEHRLVSPSNVLVPALVISLLLASRLRNPDAVAAPRMPPRRRGSRRDSQGDGETGRPLPAR